MIAKQILETLAATADIERFGEWKDQLENALKKLDKKYSKKKKSKIYKKQKAELKKKVKNAADLLIESKERLEKAKGREINLFGKEGEMKKQKEKPPKKARKGSFRELIEKKGIHVEEKYLGKKKDS